MASVTELYGVAAAASVILLITVRSVLRLRPFLNLSDPRLQKNIVYPRLLRRRRCFGPWTYAQVALQPLYFAANLFCIVFRVSDTNEAATRAGNLSLINMILPTLDSTRALLPICSASHFPSTTFCTHRRVVCLSSLVSFVLLFTCVARRTFS
jgi:hypothetical protein